jgi:hypothetical protein
MNIAEESKNMADRNLFRRIRQSLKESRLVYRN